MTGKTNVDVANSSNLTTASNINSVDILNLSATDHDEEDEKFEEISVDGLKSSFFIGSGRK